MKASCYIRMLNSKCGDDIILIYTNTHEFRVQWGNEMGRDVYYQNRDRFIQLGIAIATLRRIRGLSQEKLAEKAGIFEAQQTWMQIPALPVTSCMILDMILISQCTCMSNGVNNNCFLLLRLWILNAAVKPFVKYLEYCEKSSFPACVVCIG